MGDTPPIVTWYTCFLVLQNLHAALSQCSGTLTLTASVTPTKFVSPGYPTSYTNNLNCQWLLDSGVAGQPVVLYSDHYNLDCSFGDLINIYDGATTSDTVLQSNICGVNLTTTIFSTSGRYALVTFVTDGASTSQGLQMTYLTATDTSGSGCSAEYAVTATTSAQYLTSEGFPASYAGNSACRWLITGSGSLTTLELEITWSDIEHDASCAYDKLAIYDGSYICENKVILTACVLRMSADESPVTLTTTSNSSLIIFTSDNTVNKRGFIITYKAIITTTTTTTTAAPTTAALAMGATRTDTTTEVNIPLMVVSAVSGAGTVLLIIATVWIVKKCKAKKKSSKQGVMTVQSIAPLPARPTLFAQRQNNHILSFV